MDALLEIEIIGEDADEFVDQRPRQVMPRAGLVETLVEPGGARTLVLVAVIGIASLRLLRADRLLARQVDRYEGCLLYTSRCV